MRAHFVTFYSPGTFTAESTTKPIESWDVETACEMARQIEERYTSTPYAFQFSTRERSETELDSRVIETSPMYFLGGIVETLDQVKSRTTGKDSILIGNMESNGWHRIITNSNSWKWAQPLNDTDIVLDWKKR